MAEISGINSQTYQRLPEEDRVTAPVVDLPQQSAEQPQQSQTNPPPLADPATATTPEQAVQLIHALPVPTVSDLSGLPSYAQQSIYEARASLFNQTRAAAAQDALDRMAPQRSDYASLNGATANYEFGDAQQHLNSNPYVQELQRVVEEATTAPTDIPSYLTASDANLDTQAIPLPQMRGVLAMLGIDLPDDATPQQISDGYQLLATIPDDLLGALINPGSQVSYQMGAGSLGSTSFLPASARASVTVEGQVELSDVQTGVNFEQTQQFRMSVQVQGEQSADLSKTPLQRIYKWADRLGQLPEGVRDLANSSPLMRQVMRGLPVSGAYSEFTGSRLTYEAVVTPEQGTQLADGDLAAAPNPLDPLNMPSGTSVLIRGQSLEGSTFEASYKLLTVGGTHTDLSGLGFGVRRGEGAMVEIYSGPVDTVENTMFLGLGKQGVAAIGLTSEFSSETREMSIAKIDLSTTEGQAAYQQFMSTGQVPNWTPPGVPQSGTTTIYSGEHASFVGVQLGSATFGSANGSEITITQTQWQDGTIEQQNTYNSSNGLTTDIRFPLDAAGKPIDAQTEWTIVRADLDPASTSYLNASYNTDDINRQFDGNQHIQMTFTTDQLMELRDRARDAVVAIQGQEKLDNLDSGYETPWWSDTDSRLAVAQTPDEVYAVLSDDMHGTTVVADLLGLSMQSGEPTTGRLRIRDAG